MGFVQFEATENWTDAAQGSEAVFYTTPPTTVVPAISMTLLDSGIALFAKGARLPRYSGATAVVLTDANIDAATSLTPATAGDGFIAWLTDSTYGRLLRIGSNGSDWYYWQMSVAL